MNPQDQMMQQMFKVQIAMLAHGVINGYRESAGLELFPQFDELDVGAQNEVIENVEFWLANPTAPASASHEVWLARNIEQGWRLGETLDEQAKTSPYIRPFDSLPKETRTMEYLFHAAVRAVTYTQDAAPAYKRRIDMINYAAQQKFPDDGPEEAGQKWNALPEDERMAILNDLQAQSDAARADMEKRRDWIDQTLKRFEMTPAAWMELTEEERVAKLDEHGAATGLGNWYTDEQKAQIAAQQAAIEAMIDNAELQNTPAPNVEGMVPANDEPPTPAKLSESDPQPVLPVSGDGMTVTDAPGQTP